MKKIGNKEKKDWKKDKKGRGGGDLNASSSVDCWGLLKGLDDPQEQSTPRSSQIDLLVGSITY